MGFVLFLLFVFSFLCLCLAPYHIARREYSKAKHYYRIVEKNGRYHIQFRKWWDPFWVSHSWYHIPRYGGKGWISSSTDSIEEAHKEVKNMKRRLQERVNRPPKSPPKVVHEETYKCSH